MTGSASRVLPPHYRWNLIQYSSWRLLYVMASDTQTVGNPTRVPAASCRFVFLSHWPMTSSERQNGWG